MSIRSTAIFAVATTISNACAVQAPVESEVSTQDPRPNIVLIVADDLGFADLGNFGSDIRTPHIDALAAEGMRFTQFRTATMCAPTRAMLLSGNNNHVAGVGRQSPTPLMQAHLPGYEGYLSERVAKLPALLREAGYHTYMAGKWHLGRGPEHGPGMAGFERSFVMLDGAGSHFDNRGFGVGSSEYREDGESIEWPEGAYSTELYTDRLIDFIEENRGDGRPFFLYAAYTSPHWPLQVPADQLDRYVGAYDEGYDVLRERNFANLKAAGVIPADSELPPRNGQVRPWAELDPEERRRSARKMELYAAMVENLDGHVGRLLQYLKDRGLYESTLVVFMSDNGAAPGDFYNSSFYGPSLQALYDNRYENMGGPDSFVSYGEPWAEAGSAPFKRYKTYTTEGGIRAPMIMAGHGVAKHGATSHAYVTVMDLAPTFLELGGAQYPNDGSVAAMLGESMAALMRGEAGEVHDEHYVTLQYHWGRAYLRQGRWKLTHVHEPFEETAFQLHDLESDPGETTDLSEQFPDQRARLIELWRQHRQELGMVLPQDL